MNYPKIVFDREAFLDKDFIMATDAENELNEYREEQKRQDRMLKEAEEREYQIEADESDLTPPPLNEDGSLAPDPDLDDEDE